MGGMLLLRSDRDIRASGRVYLIRGRAADQCSTTVNDDGYGCCTVVVPRIPSIGSILSVMADATDAEAVCNGTFPGSNPGDIPAAYVNLVPEVALP